MSKRDVEKYNNIVITIKRLQYIRNIVSIGVENFASIQVCEFNSKRVITVAQYIEKKFSQGNHLNPSLLINMERNVFVTYTFGAMLKKGL